MVSLCKLFGSIYLAIYHLNLALAVPCANDTLILPSKDPWYTAPDGFESTPPGTVLRVRFAPGNITDAVFAGKGWQILYRTTDSRNKPTFAVTSFFTPRNSAGPYDNVVSFQIPYDSADIDASPSYALNNLKSLRVALPIPIMLASGFAVNTPDMEGPLAACTAGIISGQATLDSLRAVKSMTRCLQLTPNPKLALWGYSGGALASEWAAELQSEYAPDLDFVGMVVGGLPVNVLHLLNNINETPFAGLVVVGILGLLAQYPEIRNEYLEGLKTSGPYNRTGFLAAEHSTSTHVDYAGQDLAKYFKQGMNGLDSPELQYIAHREGIMGKHGVPKMPTYVHHAVHDEVCPIEDADSLIDEYCRRGASIHYRRNKANKHVTEGIAGTFPALEFLRDQFNNSAEKLKEQAKMPCKIETVTDYSYHIPDDPKFPKGFILADYL